ncbi:hypothetical protein SARC_08370 [Sphaeroforma arctica JP610]|uniref:GrpE protein homolog n=1 Tax=Sphaeroforma arctica JP610 TaxID=667725 RepID=A0A0L0FRN0_9EUKA|nr:hypothetical protein SARC_08370 [Sphaeroforma arctica JP610]KNC79221.1 hypothetical protein SARC_08370 [Sphaeroforma arctica JP610]|eukprot:XP_014153123.1 hypothetical protein SARC_08370 [Sphaeroforma arctica JP610]
MSRQPPPTNETDATPLSLLGLPNFSTDVMQTPEFTSMLLLSTLGMATAVGIALVQTRRLRTLQQTMSQRYSVQLAQIESRLKRDAVEAKGAGVRAVATDMLGVVDNFDRALKAAEGTETAKTKTALQSLLKGVQMTRTGLLDALHKHNIQQIPALGTKFDPNLHEAVFQYADKKLEVGSVGSVVLEGYTWNDRVLRASKVGVVSEPSDDKPPKK